jgi:hypothetical protein
MAACTITDEQLQAASCFACLQADQREAVKTYLLAVIAGGSLDPQVLLAEAKCFTCVQPDHQKAIQNSLLCQILNL